MVMIQVFASLTQVADASNVHAHLQLNAISPRENVIAGMFRVCATAGDYVAGMYAPSPRRGI